MYKFMIYMMYNVVPLPLIPHLWLLHLCFRHYMQKMIFGILVVLRGMTHNHSGSEGPPECKLLESFACWKMG